MTRFCRRYPELVGPRYWLPPEPFEFGWTTRVGCNNLRCERCGSPVRAEVTGERRHYACACQEHDETGVFLIDGEPDDLYPPILTDWVCAGHPDLLLPATVDGVRLDAATDWDTVAAEAVLDPPFTPPLVELHAAWPTRLYRLLGAERVQLSHAVARLLAAEDPRLVRGAYHFFFNEPSAEGAESLAPSVVARRDWLGSVPELLDQAAVLLHERLRLVDEAGGPVDRTALDAAQELALAGIGPSHTPLALPPEWLLAHAKQLAGANGRWISALVFVAKRLPAAQRDQLLRDLEEVAPEPVRAAITQHFRTP